MGARRVWTPERLQIMKELYWEARKLSETTRGVNWQDAIRQRRDLYKKLGSPSVSYIRKAWVACSRILSGRCVHCPNQVYDNHTLCPECLENLRVRAKKYNKTSRIYKTSPAIRKRKEAAQIIRERWISEGVL